MSKNKQSETKPAAIAAADTKKPAAIAAADTEPAPANDQQSASREDENRVPVSDLNSESMASVALMEIAFGQWMATIMAPLFYPMTQGFYAHQIKRGLGSPDLNPVFRQFLSLNAGKHGDFFEDIQAYRETLLDELKSFLAGRQPSK